MQIYFIFFNITNKIEIKEDNRNTPKAFIRKLLVVSLNCVGFSVMIVKCQKLLNKCPETTVRSIHI